MKSRMSLIVKNAGIAGAVLVPALVIAQMQQTQPPPPAAFQPNGLLSAGSLAQMRQALADAVARIDALEARASGGSSITKAQVYTVRGDSSPAAAGALVSLSSPCEDANDVALDCTCTGAGANSTNLDLRVVAASNEGERGDCTCFAQNVGTGPATLSAIASCLRVP